MSARAIGGTVMKFVRWFLFAATIFGLSTCRSKLDTSTTVNTQLPQILSVTPVLHALTPQESTIAITPVPSLTPKMVPTATQLPQHQMIPTTTSQMTSTSTIPKMVPDELRKYIGIHYPPLPDGLAEGFGMLIVPSDIGDYSLSGVHKGDLHMLWLSKQALWKSGGKWYQGWETLDIIFLPVLEGESEVLIPDGCKINGDLDPEIIVVAVLDEEAYNTRYVTNEKIKQAWRANRLAGAFEEIPTDGIECYADNATGWK